MRKRINGIIIPVITPFRDQELDLSKLEYNINKTLDLPVSGYMVLGSNGEFIHMDDKEQLMVLKKTREIIPSDRVLIAGISRQSAHSTIKFGKKVINMGADYVSVLPPSYFNFAMTDDILIKYYIYIAERLSAPIIIYNCPKYTSGISLSDFVIAELAKHPNIVGMKDTSKGNIQKYLSVVKNIEFDVIAGSLENFLEGIDKGAVGGILSMANYMPSECHKVQMMYESGLQQQAWELNNKLMALNNISSGQYSVAGVKVCCDIFGFQGGEVRLPLIDCTYEERELIKATFRALGYLTQ